MEKNKINLIDTDSTLVDDACQAMWLPMGHLVVDATSGVEVQTENSGASPKSMKAAAIIVITA